MQAAFSLINIAQSVGQFIRINVLEHIAHCASANGWQHIVVVAEAAQNQDAALAEDAVQESFIKAYRALNDFKGKSRLSTWLHRITYLTAIDLQRQKQRHLRLADTSYDEDLGADTNALARSESSAERQRLQNHIDNALECLSSFELTVFTLRHMKNFKLQEIAEVVDRSEGTVKNILFRAIRKLRDQLGAEHLRLQEFEQC